MLPFLPVENASVYSEGQEHRNLAIRQLQHLNTSERYVYREKASKKQARWPTTIEAWT